MSRLPRSEIWQSPENIEKSSKNFSFITLCNGTVGGSSLSGEVITSQLAHRPLIATTFRHNHFADLPSRPQSLRYKYKYKLKYKYKYKYRCHPEGPCNLGVGLSFPINFCARTNSNSNEHKNTKTDECALGDPYNLCVILPLPINFCTNTSGK